jgi:hypothetical protein
MNLPGISGLYGNAGFAGMTTRTPESILPLKTKIPRLFQNLIFRYYPLIVNSRISVTGIRVSVVKGKTENKSPGMHINNELRRRIEYGSGQPTNYFRFCTGYTSGA